MNKLRGTIYLLLGLSTVNKSTVKSPIVVSITTAIIIVYSFKTFATE